MALDPRRIFRDVAPRYDLMKALLTFGLERRAKRNSIQRLLPNHGLLLDLAAGTGDVLEIAGSKPGLVVIAFDISVEMLKIAESRRPDALAFIQGDLNHLPLQPNAVDVCTVSYGVRYLDDIRDFAREAHRVIKSGGQLIIFDLNKPRSVLLRAALYIYLSLTGTILGLLLHGRVSTYWHLVESLHKYPGHEALIEALKTAGFVRVQRRSHVFGSLIMIHATL